MQEPIKNIIKDGLILLAASIVLAVGTNQIFELFKDKALDGNPIVSSVAKAVSSDRSQKEGKQKRQEKIDKGEKVEQLDQKSLDKLLFAESQIRKQLDDNMNPAENDGINYITFRDVNQATALMMICNVNYNEAKKALEQGEDRLPYVQLLIDRGSDINAVDKHGWTAMCWASWSNLPEIVALFLEKGCDVNITDKKGNTPLMMAAVRGNVETIKTLLAKGADKQRKCSSGMTAYDYAKREYERISLPSIIAIGSAEKKVNTKRLAEAMELLK